MDIGYVFAENIMRTSAANLPLEVMEMTKKCILDLVGCIFAGSALSTDAENVVKMFVEAEGREEATIIGQVRKVPAWSAAFANGVLAHALDFDDIVDETAVHPSLCTIPDRPVHGPGALNHLAGPMLSDDLETNIAGTRGFVRACTAKPLLPEEFDFIVAFNMMCPSYVKRSILLWSGEYKETLSKIQIPVLITQGKADEIVLPEAAEYTAEVVPGAKISWYDGVGHSPFWENPSRFNDELAGFVRGARDH